MTIGNAMTAPEYEDLRTTIFKLDTAVQLLTAELKHYHRHQEDIDRVLQETVQRLNKTSNKLNQLYWLAGIVYATAGLAIGGLKLLL